MQLTRYRVTVMHDPPTATGRPLYERCEVYKADEVRAVLHAYIQRGERLLNDLIDTSDSAESFRYWIEELKKEIAP